MEKKEKRPGYFARLKKRRQLRQSQSEKAVTEESHLEPDSKGPIICAPAPAKQRQSNNPEGDKSSNTERTLRGGSDDNRKSNGQDKKEKRKPPGTVEYTVGPKDTLNGISLKFNITPNKLVQLNRLFSRSVVPGQKLFVPDVGQLETDGAANASPNLVNLHSHKESLDGKLSCRSGIARHRELSPPSEDESPATVKFLKMSCKYFTDGMGVVGGVMIVTPNNIMFDPHKSDPLVIEHGCEEYGLICPMEEVLSVALYDDVSRMKLKDALPSDIPQDLCPLYRPGEWVELPSEQDLNPFSRYETLGQPSRPIILDDIDAADSETVECHPADKSPSDEGFTELELLQNDSSTENGNAETFLSRPETADTGCLDLGGSQEMSDCEKANVSGQPLLDQSTEGVVACDVDQEEKEDEGLHSHTTNETAELAFDGDRLLPAGTGPGQTVRSLDVADEVNKTGTEILTSDASLVEAAGTDQNGKVSPGDATGDFGNGGSSGPSHKADTETMREPNLEREQIKKEIERQAEETEMKSWLLKRMQGPIEDMLLSTEEKSKNPPMFLCFKVGKPMRKSFASGRTSSPAHSFGARGKQPEYWFAVPQERVDHLYSFFIQWSPDAYGKDAQEQGFVVVEKDELNMIDNFFSDPMPRSWEIITINEAKRRQSFCSYEEEEPLDMLSVLTEPSTLLEDTHVEKLAARLPARVQGYPWRLAYSTVVHGTSLKTLYRNLGELDCPVLLVIKDMDDQVYGAFSTHPFRVSEHYYGTGETFLYTFNPEIKVFRWTGENSYFVKGNLDSLQIGGGGGHLGLWLDADLYHGTTSKCSTFNNQPLSSQQDFTIQNLEVWAFE
ncbi:nuclear receptor coactivator 7 isoform X1 [Electrophorus electricus]|uniref:nuclear receptor coactivator 7 isoform X1 n=1 Tax=Electrophorus electricus TaxID=8005 RepID=UPI0015D0539A|nr:nuclear receptor coactivator 7 isoform X1 [Electrophorus electricus]XP_026856983.2 nuclear receptor coactivator 7 isoform X1 [Electrophorus electricus]